MRNGAELQTDDGPAVGQTAQKGHDLGVVLAAALPAAAMDKDDGGEGAGTRLRQVQIHGLPGTFPIGQVQTASRIDGAVQLPGPKDLQKRLPLCRCEQIAFGHINHLVKQIFPHCITSSVG